jgi:hypothetical protein
MKAKGKRQISKGKSGKMKMYSFSENKKRKCRPFAFCPLPFAF